VSRIAAVFFEDQTGREARVVVAIEYGNSGLLDDGAVIEFGIDEMYSTAGDPDSMIERLLLGMEARESG